MNLKDLLGKKNKVVLKTKEDNTETEITVVEKNGEAIVPEYKKSIILKDKTDILDDIESFFYYKLSPEFTICNDHEITCRHSLSHGNTIDYKKYRDTIIKTEIVLNSLSEDVGTVIKEKEDVFSKIISITQEDYYRNNEDELSFKEKAYYQSSILNSVLSELNDWNDIKNRIMSIEDKFLDKSLVSVISNSPVETRIRYGVVVFYVSIEDRKVIKVCAIEGEGKERVFLEFRMNISPEIDSVKINLKCKKCGRVIAHKHNNIIIIGEKGLEKFKSEESDSKILIHCNCEEINEILK